MLVPAQVSPDSANLSVHHEQIGASLSFSTPTNPAQLKGTINLSPERKGECQPCCQTLGQPKITLHLYSSKLVFGTPTAGKKGIQIPQVNSQHILKGIYQLLGIHRRWVHDFLNLFPIAVCIGGGDVHEHLQILHSLCQGQELLGGNHI